MPVGLLKNNFLVFLPILTLLGCDTFSTYRVESKQYFEISSPTKHEPYRFKINLDDMDVQLHISFIRFNFDYRMFLEIENKGKIPINFDIDDIFVLRKQSGKTLNVEKVWQVDQPTHTSKPLSKDTVVVIAPNETKKFSYSFEKISAFFRRQIGKSNEKNLTLILNGLSKPNKKMPTEFELTLSR